MKTLVVYATRTGTSKKVAEKIADRTGAEVLEVVDLVKREGSLRFVIAGFHASTKRHTPIGPITKDVAQYDVVVLVSPIWAGGISSPMRTFLRDKGSDIKQFALVVSHLDTKGLYPQSLTEVENTLGKKSIAFGSLCSGQGDERLAADLEPFLVSVSALSGKE